MSSFFQRALQAQQEMEVELLSKQNVVGVAIGYREADGEVTGTPAVVVLVERKMPPAALSARDMVPKEIEGVRTDVYEVGYLQAQQAPTERFRPVVPSGVSMGHYKVTAGTFGAVVKDRTTGEKLLLSNNHVFAESNNAAEGDDILQPAPTDGGKIPGDVVAKLGRFIPLNYLEGPITTPPPDDDPEPPPPSPPGDGGTSGGCDVVEVLVSLSNLLAGLSGSEKRVTATSAQSLEAQTTPVPGPKPDFSPSAQTTRAQANTNNVVDAALARPLDADMFSGEMLNIGMIEGTRPPELGMNIRKMGRTTAFTTGQITLLNATVTVNYMTIAGPRSARFTGQVISTPMSKGGDSGSLIVHGESNNAVGLLFAGSDRATIFTPINTVMSALNIEF